MQKYSLSNVTDLGPVEKLTTDRPGPLIPTIPKMRRILPAKTEPIISVTVERSRNPIRKPVRIVESKPLFPPLLNKKSKPIVKKNNLVSSTSPRRRQQNMREMPAKFIGKETVKIKPVPVLKPTPPVGVKGKYIPKKPTPPLTVRWRV